MMTKEDAAMLAERIDNRLIQLSEELARYDAIRAMGGKPPKGKRRKAKEDIETLHKARVRLMTEYWMPESDEEKAPYSIGE